MTGRKKTASKAVTKEPVVKEEPKKKVDVFSLFKQEKIVLLKDNDGNEVHILMVKPTQGERTKLLEKYVDILSTVKEEYSKRDKETGYYTRAILALGKQHLIEGIISYQRAQKTELIDLYPFPNDETLTEKAREDLQKGLVSDWEKEKMEDLNKMSTEKLREELSTITLDGLSLIESGRKFDILSIHLMCLDPDTRAKIFSSPDEVEMVRDRRVLDTLLQELNEFRVADSMPEVRKVSEESDFLAPGESVKK